jgi:NAD(P)H-hydrate repair Nnr-like enzyme with NAD(P)H-hydrate dehydratase domain
MGAHDALDVVALSEQVLRDWPLPAVAADGDKEVRGSVLIVAGSFEMPGAAILAATNALRAGAGKLTVATDVRVAQHVAMAVPEARVVGMRLDGSEVASCREALGADAADAFDAVVIGPGMPDDDGCARCHPCASRGSRRHATDSRRGRDARGASQRRAQSARRAGRQR